MRIRECQMVPFVAMLVVALAHPASAQNKRDEKVRNDRLSLLDDKSWYYDDLESGIKAARESGKPLMVVLRCIP